MLYPGLFCIKKILQGSEFTLESDFAESRRFVQTDVKSEKVSIDKNWKIHPKEDKKSFLGLCRNCDYLKKPSRTVLSNFTLTLNADQCDSLENHERTILKSALYAPCIGLSGAMSEFCLSQRTVEITHFKFFYMIWKPNFIENKKISKIEKVDKPKCSPRQHKKMIFSHFWPLRKKSLMHSLPETRIWKGQKGKRLKKLSLSGRPLELLGPVPSVASLHCRHPCKT